MLTRKGCHYSVVILLMLLSSTISLQAKDKISIRNAVECTARKGLPNFFKKLKDKKSIRIGYFGGSITAQRGWRIMSLDYFRKKYPHCSINEINASIGGTGSELGAFRIDHDIFLNKPDLLFVEFAVNDAGKKTNELTKTMEAIVRKTWRNLPECDICFVYTIRDCNFNELTQGKMSRAASTMETVADYYDIPSIHLGIEAAKLFGEGKLRIKNPHAKIKAVAGEDVDNESVMPVADDGKIPFSNDGVHPLKETGHKLYMNAIARSLPIIQAASQKNKVFHILPHPIKKDNLENAIMISLDKVKLTGSWETLPADNPTLQYFGKFVYSILKAKPGSELSFKFKGTKVMIYDFIGPDSGNVEICIDGKTTVRKRIDGYSISRRLGTLKVGENLTPDTVHEVKIKVLADKLDKKAILFEQNRKDFDRHPQKYIPTDWYVGGVMLIGNLVK